MKEMKSDVYMMIPESWFKWGDGIIINEDGIDK